VVWSGYQYAVHGDLYRLLTVLRLSHQSRPHQRNTVSDVQRQWLDQRIPLHKNTTNGNSNGSCSVHNAIQKTKKTFSPCRESTMHPRPSPGPHPVDNMPRCQLQSFYCMIRASYPNHVHFGVKLPYRQDGIYFSQPIY